MKICSKCQAECDDQMKFCLNCGAPFDMVEGDTTVIGEIPVQAEPAAGEVPGAEALAAEGVPGAAGAPASAEISAAAAASAAAEASNTANAAAAAAGGAAPAQEDRPPVTPENTDDGTEPEAPSGKVKRTMSVFAVLSIIFSIIGIFSGGYACLLSFLNILIALAFYIPSALGIVFGLIALRGTGRDRKHKGRILAFVGIILGVLSVVLWLIGTFYLRGRVAAEFGTMDLMSVVRVISTKM